MSRQVTYPARVGLRRGALPRPLLEKCGEPVGFGPLAPGELSGQHVEVDLRKIDEWIRFNSLGGGPDDVLLRTDRPVEQVVDGVGYLVDVRLGRPRHVGDALGQRPDNRDR